METTATTVSTRCLKCYGDGSIRRWGQDPVACEPCKGTGAITITDVTQATPAAIDTILADLWYETMKYRMWAMDIAKRLDGDRYYANPHNRAEAEKTLAEYQDKIAELRAEAQPLEAEFDRRGGWARYYLVNNSNGHVHKDMECTTCFIDTQYLWLPSVSDFNEEQMVAEFGETACTVCFPSAPTYKGYGDGTSSFARLTVAQKAERDAEKAAKAAAKAEKAITAPDGSPLRDADGYEIKTAVAARNKLSEYTEDVARKGRDAKCWRGDVTYGEMADRMEAALVAKGWPQEKIDKTKKAALKRAGSSG